MSAATSLVSPASREARRFQLRLPMILLWLVLLPLTPLLWLALLIVCVAGGVNPFRAVSAIFRTLLRSGEHARNSRAVRFRSY